MLLGESELWYSLRWELEGIVVANDVSHGSVSSEQKVLRFVKLSTSEKSHT